MACIFSDVHHVSDSKQQIRKWTEDDPFVSSCSHRCAIRKCNFRICFYPHHKRSKITKKKIEKWKSEQPHRADGESIDLSRRKRNANARTVRRPRRAEEKGVSTCRVCVIHAFAGAIIDTLVRKTARIVAAVMLLRLVVRYLFLISAAIRFL